MRVAGESPTVEKTAALRAELDQQHERINEIRLIAQALAFREADPSDVAGLVRLVNEAHAAERSSPSNPAGFNPNPLIDEDTVAAMVADPACQWLLVEAPIGLGGFPDGTLLGCACYSVGGAAANTPDRVGAIRILAVAEQFQGLCVGQRLLARVEKEIKAAGCQRSLTCIPNRACGVLSWAERRGYEQAGVAQYPDRVKAAFTKPTELVVMAKGLVPPLPPATEATVEPAPQTRPPETPVTDVD